MVHLVLFYLLNDTIKTADDIEKYLGINTLGLIPLEEGTSKRRSHGKDKTHKRGFKLKNTKSKKRRPRRSTLLNQFVEMDQYILTIEV